MSAQIDDENSSDECAIVESAQIHNDDSSARVRGKFECDHIECAYFHECATKDECLRFNECAISGACAK